MRRVFFILFCFVFFLSFPQRIFASESIIRFQSDILAKKDGSMQVTEAIDYNFGEDFRHGIFRTIPTVSSVGNLFRVIGISFTKILRDGKEEPFTVSKTDDQIEVKIGSPDRTMNGHHVYTLSYIVTNAIGSNYADHDEIYWNVTGNTWDVPIDQVYAQLHAVDVRPSKALCFTGISGSTRSDCRTEVRDGTLYVLTTKSLSSDEGLTLVSRYSVGSFPKSILQTKSPAQQHTDFIIVLVAAAYIFFNLLLAPLLLYWYFKHKTKERFGKVTANFSIPEDIKGKRLIPAEVGTIDAVTLERDDVTATLFDLAIHKYIKLEHIEKKGLFGHDDLRVIKLKDFSDTTSFEKTLLKRLFQSSDTVLISSLKTDFYETFTTLQDEIFDLLTTKGFYTGNPAAKRGMILVFAILSLVTGNLFLAGVLFFLHGKFLNRTKLGDETDFHIDGLKLFLKSMDRNYKWQADQLYIVEQMIPYAIALGYIEKFMEMLKIIKPDYHPAWYVGSNFYTSYGSAFSSVASNVTTSAPSSSSGFSSGSSGGGGGGGGGGSW